jgi:uncharacterized membrane protein
MNMMLPEHEPEPDNERATRADAAPGGGPAIETVISWILRIGVTASAVLIAAGVLLLFFTSSTGYGGALGNLNGLVRYGQNAGDRFPTTPGDVFSGLVGLRPYALIAFGLLLLIATPVVRVAASVVFFWLERDMAYVFITFLVLLILIISFLLGKAG